MCHLQENIGDELGEGIFPRENYVAKGSVHNKNYKRKQKRTVGILGWGGIDFRRPFAANGSRYH